MYKLKTSSYLSPGRSLTLAVISPASGVNFSTSSRGPQKDLFWPRNVFLPKKWISLGKNLKTDWVYTTHQMYCAIIIKINEQMITSLLCEGHKWGSVNTLRTVEFGLGFVALTFKSMFQTVLHDDKKLLQWGIVRVQCAAQVQCRFNQALDAQLGHVHQVKPLNGNGVLGIWK